MAQQDEKALNREEKLKALEAAIVKLEKDYGKGAVMKLGDGASMNVETVPTGSLSLDIALGLGGIPKGRVIEIYGPESSSGSDDHSFHKQAAPAFCTFPCSDDISVQTSSPPAFPSDPASAPQSDEAACCPP